MPLPDSSFILPKPILDLNSIEVLFAFVFYMSLVFIDMNHLVLQLYISCVCEMSIFLASFYF